MLFFLLPCTNYRLILSYLKSLLPKPISIKLSVMSMPSSNPQIIMILSPHLFDLTLSHLQWVTFQNQDQITSHSGSDSLFEVLLLQKIKHLYSVLLSALCHQLMQPLSQSILFHHMFKLNLTNFVDMNKNCFY